MISRLNVIVFHVKSCELQVVDNTFKPKRLCAEPPPPNVNVSVRKGDVGGFIISTIGANACQFTLTFNLAVAGALDR